MSAEEERMLKIAIKISIADAKKQKSTPIQFSNSQATATTKCNGDSNIAISSNDASETKFYQAFA